MELSASHAYLTMAAYFDRADVALPGFKAPVHCLVIYLFIIFQYSLW